ncbi:hypothetical protein [Streptomyces sp. 1114.5]|uniref:hypothetical protein n=1 Tax=Streptomyces sp. 1114.5 TaxID=1938830 RepID=UPI0011C3FE8D|nr:hypothetical protein [Streptomyces sp. 1114.5]
MSTSHDTPRERRPHAPHPPPLSLVGPYVYSYDVSASPSRSTTASRSIPGMRPSYDAEHPHSTTPIYDELYSEYRRLFRALPGDRSGEEDLMFTGFAVRDSYPLLGEQRPPQHQHQQPHSHPPQHQAFHTLAGQMPGLPQFVSPHLHGSGSLSGHQTGHHGSHHPGAHSAHTGHTSHATHTGHHHVPTAPTSDGPGHTTPAPGPSPTLASAGAHSPAHPQHANSAPQFANGQGWVAAGYLGPPPHSMTLPVPAPAPPAPPAPSPVMGTATGLATAPATGGRHRQMLSLPPGRNGDHH